MRFEDGYVVTDTTDRCLAELPHALPLNDCESHATRLQALADWSEGRAHEHIDLAKRLPDTDNLGQIRDLMTRARLSRQAAGRLLSFMAPAESLAADEAAFGLE